MSNQPESTRRSGFNSYKVVHIHPTTLCNLECKHCYSRSGGGRRKHVAVSDLLSGLSVLKEEGYGVVSLSGGEPFLYKDFETLLIGATELGFKISMITNGAPLTQKTIPLVDKYVDLIAVSIDGNPEVHNEIRQNTNAFGFIEKAGERLRENGIKFGLAYCVTTESIDQMVWAWEFAQEIGASVIQYHPFAAIGRGESMGELSLDKHDLMRAYTIGSLLPTSDNLKVQVDLVPSSVALDRKGDYKILALEKSNTTVLADLVNPCVIDEQGTLLPFCYGINDSYSIGSISYDLRRQIDHWKQNGWKDAKQLISDTFDFIERGENDYIDWFYTVLQRSQMLTKVGRCAELAEER